jgi:pyruvate formate lyase activating enzyme
MSFYKVTYSEQYRRATVHNKGCNFHCLGCAYKVRHFPPVERYPELGEIKDALRGLDIERVHFMGGEPTTCRDLPELLEWCRTQLGVRTYLGHTNGSGTPLENLDGANVSFKAFSSDKHHYYTGHPAEPVYTRFREAFRAGLEMRASCVFIPGFVGLEEVRHIAEFLADLSPDIPFHIMGYIPIPGTPWPRPTEEQMAQVVAMARGLLSEVGFSHLTVEQVQDLGHRDDRFHVRQVL